jgi:hypothetical protein
MDKLRPEKNCWEVMRCGRGPGSTNGDVCPAATETRLDGVHGGINAGRACWVIAGTLCVDVIASGKFARKMETCFNCDFYRLVRKEEGDLRPHQELLIRVSKF